MSQDSKWRRDSMCWGGGACGEQKVKAKLGKGHTTEGELESE